MIGAARFARESRQLEQMCAEDREGLFLDNEIAPCVTASIFLAVAALEAHVNEEIASNGLSPEKTDCRKTKGSCVLWKYQKVLQLREKPAMDKGRCPFQDVADLIKLRNSLVHFVPEWDDENGKHKKLSERFRSKKIELSSFCAPGTDFVYRCSVSPEVADWAVSSVWNFIARFSELCQILNRLSKHRNRIFIS
ncbi:MAG: hypothetical protein R6V12_13935 [Candidatus Hydrogenedentota bacterium]